MMPAKCPEPARSSRGSSSSLYSPSSLGGSRSFVILSFESRRKPKFLYDFHHVAFLRPFAHALLLGGDGSPIFSLSMLWAKSPRDCVGSRGGSSSSYCSYYRPTNHQQNPLQSAIRMAPYTTDLGRKWSSHAFGVTTTSWWEGGSQGSRSRSQSSPYETFTG